MRPAILSVLAAVAACLAFGQAARAASFVVPQECAGLEPSGSEDELDPVVIISHNAGKTFIKTDFTVRQVDQTWEVKLLNPAAANDYLFATTYTPFLTSTLTTKVSNRASVTVPLPAAGSSPQGSQWTVYQVYTLTVNDLEKTALPRAIVDFIPAYAGASPYTMQAGEDGKIQINCLQAEGVGYAVTVRGSNGRYLYDGSFSTNSNSGFTVPR